MSDIRFVMIGVGVLSVGFIVMAVFGSQYQDNLFYDSKVSTVTKGGKFAGNP